MERACHTIVSGRAVADALVDVVEPVAGSLSAELYATVQSCSPEALGTEDLSCRINDLSSAGLANAQRQETGRCPWKGLGIVEAISGEDKGLVNMLRELLKAGCLPQ